MMQNDILSKVSAIGLVPVIAGFKDLEDSVKLAKALIDGGIPVAEVTFRMQGADVAIKKMREAYPDMLVGAGTVTTIAQAEKAIEAGALFLVSPGLNPEIVQYCQSRNVPHIPGIATASELEKAVGLGLTIVKFFPAEQSGGLGAIKALCGPYKGVSFMPTGGINLDNLAAYLSFDRVAAAGGTYMLGSHVTEGEWEKVTELCKASVRAMLGLKLIHIGINTADETDAVQTARRFAKELLLPMGKDGNSSIFVDNALEIMKGKGLGANGHIAFKCNNVTRAANYFRAIGVEMNEESAKRDGKGVLKAIYFKEEIGGFAIHLV